MSRNQDPHEGRVPDRAERVQGAAEQQVAEQHGREYGAPKGADEGAKSDFRTGERNDADAAADRGIEENTVVPEKVERGDER